MTKPDILAMTATVLEQTEKSLIQAAMTLTAAAGGAMSVEQLLEGSEKLRKLAAQLHTVGETLARVRTSQADGSIVH
jgi:hypothetical protein